MLQLDWGLRLQVLPVRRPAQEPRSEALLAALSGLPIWRRGAGGGAAEGWGGARAYSSTTVLRGDGSGGVVGEGGNLSELSG